MFNISFFVVLKGMKTMLLSVAEHCGESSETASIQSERRLGEYSLSCSISKLQKPWGNLVCLDLNEKSDIGILEDICGSPSCLFPVTPSPT